MKQAQLKVKRVISPIYDTDTTGLIQAIVSACQQTIVVLVVTTSRAFFVTENLHLHVLWFPSVQRLFG